MGIDGEQEISLICAKCRQPKAHRSHAIGFKDWIYRRVQMIPYRCHGCKTRFYAYRAGEESVSLRTPEERKVMQLRRRTHWKRTKKELGIYALGAVILVSLLYVVMQQRGE